MPGFNSHYIFGRNALDSFTPNQHEQFLLQYPQCYHLGLQGPDVFFFSPAAYLIYKQNIGSVIHKNNTQEFFKQLIDARNHLLKKEHRRMADAYITGFMAHYTMDSAIHPYIYYRTKHREHYDGVYDFGLHVFLETDINNAMLRHYLHIRPQDFPSGDTIKLNSTEHTVVSYVLHRAINKTFPDNKIALLFVGNASRFMALTNNLLMDPKGIKKWGVRFIERFFKGYAIVSPMIANDKVVRYPDPCNLSHKTWVNPWDSSDRHTESVYDMIDKITPTLVERIHLYAKAHTMSREISEDDKAMYLDKLMDSLGNRSYDSGLEY